MPCPAPLSIDDPSDGMTAVTLDPGQRLPPLLRLYSRIHPAR